MSLRYKFILVSLLIALAPLSWMGVRAVRETDRSLRTAALHQQRGLAERTADAIAHQLDRLIDLLTVLGRNMDPDASPRASERMLESAMNSNPVLTDVWLHDAGGRIRYSLHRLGPTPGLTSADRRAASTAFEESGFYRGPVFIGQDGVPRLLAAVPLWSESGRLRGILAVRANLYVLHETLRGIELGTEGRAFLLDDADRLLAHSLKETPSLPPGRTPGPNSDADRGTYASYDGKGVLGVRVPVPALNGRLIIEQPSVIALSAVDQIRRRLRATLILAAAFAAFLALVLTPLLTRPLRQFREAVRGLREGTFQSLVTADSRDEIGDIARALREAQPVLERRVRDSVLGRMSRLIGHDLRTPIQALRQGLETLASRFSAPDDTTVRHFQLCGQNLDWMEDFIEDILTVGRDRPAPTRAMNVNDVVRRTLSALRRREGVRWESVFNPNVPPSPLDDREARKAILNALKNAQEAVAPDGHVRVETTFDDASVTVIIEDDGPGFPAEKRTRLFEEFSTKESGSGLGLLVMRKVMDQHRGSLRIDDRPGGGTVVRLIFPRQ